MRKLIYGINLTLDGCCDHTKVIGSEEMLEYYAQYFLQEVDLIVYGRKTYELMIPYWPDVLKDPTSAKAEIEFAQAFCAVDKVVFSKTLDHAEDTNTRIVNTDLADEITRLKQQPGKSISVGGVDLPEQFTALGLIDEYRILVQPILAGEGRRLLESTTLPERLALKLVDTKVFPSGTVALRYVKE